MIFSTELVFASNFARYPTCECQRC